MGARHCSDSLLLRKPQQSEKCTSGLKLKTEFVESLLARKKTKRILAISIQLFVTDIYR